MNRRSFVGCALSALVAALLPSRKTFASGGIVPPGPPYIVGMTPTESTLSKIQIEAIEHELRPKHFNCRSVLTPPVVTVQEIRDICFVEGSIEFYTTNPAFSALEPNDLIELDGLALAAVESVERRFSTHVRARILPNLTQTSDSTLRSSVNTSAGDSNE